MDASDIVKRNQAKAIYIDTADQARAKPPAFLQYINMDDKHRSYSTVLFNYKSYELKYLYKEGKETCATCSTIR